MGFCHLGFDLRRRFAPVTVFLGLLALATAVDAADRGTAQEARALLDKAIAAYRHDGPQKTFAEISKIKGRFVDRDLYVFVFSPSKKIVAHGANPNLIGTEASALTDVDGKKFGLDFLRATAAGVWVDYKWENPVTKTVEAKSSFVKKVGGYIFGVGFYNP